MLLGILRAGLLRNTLVGKGITRAGYGNKKGKGAIAKRQGRGISRAGYGSKGSSIKNMYF